MRRSEKHLQKRLKEKAVAIDQTGVQYQEGVLAIRFFGADLEYDKIDAESV